VAKQTLCIDLVSSIISVTICRRYDRGDLKSAASDTLASAPTARLLTRSLNSSVVEGCAKIYREEASGAEADRRELLRMLKDLAPGEVVTVTRIDRLARSSFDLSAIVKRIVDVGGQFRSLAEPWADTSTSKQPGA
jgi:Resolvase, N terminal domain